MPVRDNRIHSDALTACTVHVVCGLCLARSSGVHITFKLKPSHSQCQLIVSDKLNGGRASASR